MANQGNGRIASPVIETDRSTLQALHDLGDYAPVNQAYSLSALQELEAALTQAEQAESRARRALDAARDQAVIAAKQFHDAVLGAKAQVIAQYGHDSLAVQAIGLTRKSERRRPARRGGQPAV